MLLAAALGGGELVEEDVPRLLELDIGGVVRVERVQAGALPGDVRLHARPDHRHPYRVPVPGPRRPVEAVVFGCSYAPILKG